MTLVGTGSCPGAVHLSAHALSHLKGTQNLKGHMRVGRQASNWRGDGCTAQSGAHSLKKAGLQMFPSCCPECGLTCCKTALPLLQAQLYRSSHHATQNMSLSAEGEHCRSQPHAALQVASKPARHHCRALPHSTAGWGFPCPAHGISCRSLTSSQQLHPQ